MALLKLPADVLARPERALLPPSSLERPWHWLRSRLHRPVALRRLGMRAQLPGIHRHAARLAALDADALRADGEALRHQLARRGITPSLARHAFALVREISRRELGMAHHDVQLLGGLAMLDGRIAEMHTGEGKTLTATLPAATAALAGIPVHVITVNDYLAARDAELMTPVYRAMGLSVAAVVHEMPPGERRAAYASDVVYCTNKELVFDYLRDTQQLGRNRHPLHAHAARLAGTLSDTRLLLRGLHFAIVDEADSVMLDEARTPLILSGPSGSEAIDLALLDEALAMAGEFEEDRHFVRESGHIHLTERGRQRLTELASSGWAGRSRREWLIQQALLARHHFHRDRHYLVRDGKVQIIDEHTGRVMADRSWEKGLQQMIERLEGCEPSEPNVTLARLTYQRFFRRYHHLSGMTGTAREVRQELWQTYRLRVVAIPPHRPSRRQYWPTVAVGRAEEKWRWISKRVKDMSDQGRAVLVATVSLADSEALSRWLDEAGVVHAMLNARQDADEAATVALAGRAGAVTVATSMAGRGTDISLDEAVKSAGGLHVIVAGHHDASRVDRQIAGRCARQGDPGSVEFVVCDEDELLDELDGWQRRLGPLASRLKLAQRKREARHARDRARLLAADWQEGEQLGFSGKAE
ncbi:preprotein translocase subunit SecA [Billgrantia kenyensis]|uniref:Protein translocase subunit SecA n=1 Tax=Billgrantia kenyensis TaxID=321266 RepID=A0A7V9VXJ6_9GAMM|nr:preprotein translocase subunit SecA [Halomonas kenyensis]MBA2777288.1 preprotein translocase subunit SecA [Halomonas kenyensis]MCG6659958.1 preprotein translocase subunit SecA [Halomonas kenyensis]